MHRFFLPPDECRGSRLVLRGREAHHAAHVLRVRAGDIVTVLDGAGKQLACEVVNTDREGVTLEITETRTVPRRSADLTLLQAVPKGKTFDMIVQKATELGASRIVPLMTERVVRQFSDQSAAARSEKWQMIAIEAIKQCGEAWLPRVEPPATPEQFLSRGEKFDLAFVASLQPDSKHPRHYFDRFRADHHRNPATVSVWIGPEGDFAPREVLAIQSSGALPITLGPLVLRTDTAAMYSLSIIQYEISWPGVPRRADAVQSARD